MSEAADVPAVEVEVTGRAPRERTFFGHPFGLFTLFTTELWERFSYYGMRAILFYFLTDTLANDGLGLDDATGAALVAVYGSAVYLVTVVGGWVADRLIGARRSVLWGGVVIAAGHVSLAVPAHWTAYLGIVLVALGTGLLKPNVSSMVGELYRRDDPRRDSGFSIFYMGINIGSFTAPFIVQIAREIGGYHAGFSVAAVGMGLALVAFVLGRRALHGAGEVVPNPLTPQDRPRVVRMALLVVLALLAATALAWLVVRAGGRDVGALNIIIDALSYLAFAAPVVMFLVMFRSPKVNTAERSRLGAYIPLFVAAMLFWMIFEQASNTLSQYARDHTDLDVGGVTISPVLYQSVNPASIILLAPVFAWLWVKLDGRPSTAVKFAIGLTLAALSFIFLAGASAVAGDGRSPWWVLVVVYVVQTLGELCLSPVGLAATTLLAPRAFRGQAMALWFLAPAAGQAITAQLITATEGMSRTAFFGGIGVVALVVAGAMFALSPWVTRRIREGAESDEDVAARA
ncbi:peptide MFS transporter [Cellulomonas sp. zg-ZUI222]|uniref:Peptide MFS transporter n=1 Tax=Cellulomonas wangleii TaxID=2816956 RepID=A0ABX8DBA0_9CELL|nr:MULTISPECIES: peptide MFS transporter [Cellulomonas]MBO0901045.1 peptide MFS transporter [Cellulomonas sp. zg-ZUI22]MBO0921702.1 peptide MFS transporter [Cellulomonas wangleii]MBO0925193.1 peptide MFS transporter [Cellulomonas wangleii]QVI63407.1 peptide MFS transporter [Cellulomonas wangleii]